MQRGVHVPANARALGSKQQDAIQAMQGYFDIRRISDGSSLIGNAVTPPFQFSAANGSSNGRLNDTLGSSLAADRVSFNASLSARTSTETRGTNAAFLPVINL